MTLKENVFFWLEAFGVQSFMKIANDFYVLFLWGIADLSQREMNHWNFGNRQEWGVDSELWIRFRFMDWDPIAIFFGKFIFIWSHIFEEKF